MKPAAMVLLFSAIFAITGTSAELRAQAGDWYSRGIIRQQTVDLIATRQKRQNYDSYLARSVDCGFCKSTARSLMHPALIQVGPWDLPVQR
jgi:hypothetical protein